MALYAQTINDAIADRVETANAAVMGYQAQIRNPNDPNNVALINNPLTKAQYINLQIKKMLLQNTKIYEAELAKQTKLTQVESELV